MVNFSLKDKIALINGASRGIGEEIAIAMARQGATCIITSRKKEALDDVVKKIEATGGRAVSFAVNMGDLDQIFDLFKKIKDQFGKLHIMVNNAATNPYFGEMAGAPESAWDKTLAVNLKGPFFAIQQAVGLMTQSGDGSIVNVSSIGGVKPAFMQGIYSITKAGLIAMTKAYAKELASKNIRVNALLPGLTKTEFSKALFENKDIHQYVVQQIPMGRHAEPEEMAGAVVYLVSDAASYTTGICLTCDGGYLA